MAKKQRNYHIGGEQLPLMVPDSPWVNPTELPDLRRVAEIAYDRETKDEGLALDKGPGWATGAGYVCGNSMAWRDGDDIRSLYIPLRHPDTEAHISPDAMKRWEIDHQKAGVKFIFHNAAYDVGWGHEDLGVPVPRKVGDTNCMAVLVDENRLSYSLDALCRWRGIPGKNDTMLTDAARCYGFARSEQDIKVNLHKLPGRYVGAYAEQDAVSTIMLAENLQVEIDKQELGQAYQLEMDLIPLVHEMRRRGVRIDMAAAEQAYQRFKREAQEALDQLATRLSCKVTIDEVRNNTWLQKVFTENGVEFPTNENGKASFEAKWMKFDEHWLPRLLVRAKSREEAAEKFVRNYIVGYACKDRLHASINQYKSDDGGARTFRFSYGDPPLQQMPHRDEDMYQVIRGIFLAEIGERWASLDYSQQEYRLIVHYAAMHNLRKAAEAAAKYNDDPRTDFHSMVAGMTGLERKPAKDANFAKSYGAGIPKFAGMIRKSQAEAEAIMTTYDREMPFNAELFKLCQDTASKRGYMILLDYARIHFNTWEPTYFSANDRKNAAMRGYKENSINDVPREIAEQRVRDPHHPWFKRNLRRARTRKAMNALIQGGAARQTKKSMRTCWEHNLVPLIQMHDELDFSFSSPEQGIQAEEIMRNSVPQLKIPMLVEAKYGINWGDATHKWEEVKV